jgi:digeranylgeranylglycerophospholipid reductase
LENRKETLENKFFLLMIMEKYDVAIIGASIAGSRVADIISKECNTLLIEEHEKIGLPVQCSGLVSHRLLELLPEIPKEIILNEVKSAKFYAPNGNCLQLSPKHPVYVINRTKLDKFLFERASKKSTVKTGEKFEYFKRMNDSILIKTNKKSYESDILIGADGPNSIVRKQMGIKPKNTILGVQATVKGNFDPSAVELWFGSKIAPDFFAWVVPIDSTLARVGLASNKNIMRFYESFLMKRVGYKRKPDVVGKIPYGLLERTCDNRIMLVGDAASQVKPFSGGGIIYGLNASEICANTCLKSFEKNRFDKKFFMENYEKKWKSKLSNPIRKGILLRNAFNIMPDVGFNFLFYASGHSKNILEEFDMDLL